MMDSPLLLKAIPHLMSRIFIVPGEMRMDLPIAIFPDMHTRNPPFSLVMMMMDLLFISIQAR